MIRRSFVGLATTESRARSVGPVIRIGIRS